jgi:two-component system sensor kinase FixL
MGQASDFLENQKVVEATRLKSSKKKPQRQDKYKIAWDILESIDDYISAFDRDWNFIYVNRKTANDFGVSPKELLGKNFWKTFPNFIGTDIEKHYFEAMYKGTVKRFEWKTIYANTGYREFTVFPSNEGITVYGVDINKRKELQRKLEEYTKNLEKLVEERTRKIRESEQSYRELYESFGEAFIATDWELNVIHWNQAAEKITKISAKEALGKKIYEILPEMDTVNVTPYFESLQEKSPTRFMMKTTSRQTGRAAIFEISTYPSTLGVIIIVEDKTEEEEMKRLLTIGQTAGMVGHDIRNPLQSIVSSMFLIKNNLSNLPKSEDRSEALQEAESILEQISYVDKIVSDLQDYARPLKLEIVEVNLKTLIANILSTLNIPENIKTKAYLDSTLPKIKTDPTLLKRVLQNLAINAVQAMPEGGKLSIKVSQDKEPDKFAITIQDTGVGIPKEIQGKLFTPLFTTKSKGQGFGLAVVKRLVEAQGGTISFKSQEGKGTKFTVSLPTQNKRKPAYTIENGRLHV